MGRPAHWRGSRDEPGMDTEDPPRHTQEEPLPGVHHPHHHAAHVRLHHLHHATVFPHGHQLPARASVGHVQSVRTAGDSQPGRKYRGDPLPRTPAFLFPGPVAPDRRLLDVTAQYHGDPRRAAEPRHQDHLHAPGA